MEFIGLGKIEYSNIEEYIGKYLRISDVNFNRIFEEGLSLNLLDNFKYLLCVGKEQRKFFNNHNILLGRVVIVRVFTLYIVSKTTGDVFETPLYYCSKHPEIEPIEVL